MFVRIDPVCIFVSCFVRVEKKVKKHENLMIFVIFVIFNRSVLCQDIGKWAEILAGLFFYVVSKKYNSALSISGKQFFRPALVHNPINNNYTYSKGSTCGCDEKCLLNVLYKYLITRFILGGYLSKVFEFNKPLVCNWLKTSWILLINVHVQLVTTCFFWSQVYDLHTCVIHSTYTQLCTVQAA